MAHRAKPGNCAKCGIWRPWLQRDHIIPKRNGGTNTEENIQFLCANCHEDKTMAENMAYRHTEDAKMKIGNWQRGKKRWPNGVPEEVRSRISQSLHGNKCAIGHRLSEKAKLEIGMLSRLMWKEIKSDSIRFDEYRKKLSERTKQQWNRQKSAGIPGVLKKIEGGAPSLDLVL